MCVREATRVRLLVALATVAGACANNDPRNDPTPPDGASDAATMPDGANSDGALQSDASDAGESCPDPSGGPPPGFSDLLTNCLPDEAAQITAVSPTQLDLVRTSDGNPIVFSWQGPDLTGRFQIGESVQFRARTGDASAKPCALDWSTVSGASHVAAVWRGSGGFGGPAPSAPPPPYDGPAISRSPLCEYQTTICDPPYSSPTLKVFALEVGTPGSTVVAKPGQTVIVGGWHVTNVEAYSAPSWDCGIQGGEDADVTTVTALRSMTDS